MPGVAAVVRDFAPKPEEAPGRHCFPRHHRLVHPRQFQNVYKNRHARRAQGRYARCIWAANDLPVARLGLAVSKHALRHSVARNLFKRLVREHFRGHPKSGIDLIVSCRRNVRLPLDRRAVCADLEQIWQGINS